MANRVQLGAPRIRTITVAAAAAYSFGAHAQSNSAVTIYGIFDTGVEYLTNVGPSGDRMIRMPSLTGTFPSRIGFRGTEDLGGGMTAVFVLEQGFSPDQGTLNQGGRAWGRQAFVGIGGAWGQISVGRQYSQIFFSLIGDTLAPNIYAAGVLDSYLPNARVDNSIAYRGTFDNWTVGATYSLGRDAVAAPAAGGCAGESSTDSKACRHVSGLLLYSTKEWGVAAAYDRNVGGAGAGSPLPLSSQTDTRKMLNGFYAVGLATIGVGFERRINEGAPANTAPTTAHSDYWWLGATYRVDTITYDLQYGSLKYSGSTTGNGSRVLAARAMYHLSKRTAVYATAGHIDNQGTSAVSIDGGNISGSAPVAGGRQSGVMLGMRHFF